MPAYPYRKNRRGRWQDSRIEHWEPPSSTRRDLIGGAVLGLAIVGALWVITNVAGMLS